MDYFLLSSGLCASCLCPPFTKEEIFSSCCLCSSWY